MTKLIEFIPIITFVIIFINFEADGVAKIVEII